MTTASISKNSHHTSFVRSNRDLTVSTGPSMTRPEDYRERALKIHPWICAKCAREFSGKKLPELTVHHKDHNHDNNPADGSNWELLCLYCHDNEHSRSLEAKWQNQSSPGEDRTQKVTHNPFAGIKEMLKK